LPCLLAHPCALRIEITLRRLKPICEKWYGIIEGLLPGEGFINGLATPTMADLAVLVIAKGCMPFQAAPTMAGCAPGDKYPKMERVATAAAAYKPIADFLAKSEHKTLTADPFGIMGAQ